MNTDIEIIPGVPENLEVLVQGDQRGFLIKTGFKLALTHTLMGYFPVIFRETQREVVTIDEDLMRDVWKTLTPRRATLRTEDLYVHPQLGIYYQLPTQYQKKKDCPAMRFLTRSRFEELMQTEQPFVWEEGLISNDMSQEEFVRTIKAALATPV